MKLHRFARMFNVLDGDVIAYLDKGPGGEALVHVICHLDDFFCHIAFFASTPQIAVALLAQLDEKKLEEMIGKVAASKKNGTKIPDETLTYTCQADEGFPMDKAVEKSMKYREPFADSINLKEHVNDLLTKIERDGFQGLALQVERKFYNVPKEEWGWSDCYAAFVIAPDLERNTQEALSKIEVHDFFVGLGEWFHKRLPKGINVNILSETGQFEIFDPVRMQKKNQG